LGLVAGPIWFKTHYTLGEGQSKAGSSIPGERGPRGKEDDQAVGNRHRPRNFGGGVFGGNSLLLKTNMGKKKG